MSRISESALVNWQNGMVVNAEKMKQDRAILVTAINDNYERISDLQGLATVATIEEQTWEALDGQTDFVLPGTRTFPNIDNVLEVSVEGFDMVEGDEFIKLDEKTIRLSAPVSLGTRVYAKWYGVKSLNLFTLDLQAYTIMGVF